jgi:Tfp pilus assembly protein PilO
MGFKFRERILVVAAGVCIVLLMGDRFIVTPLYRLWKARAERISLLKQNLEKGALLLDRKGDIDQRWLDMNERSLSADIAEAENKILNAVNSWASRSSFNLSSIKPRWLHDEVNSKKLEFRLSGTGDVESLYRFLYEIESDSLAIKLEDIEISSRDEKTRDLALSVRFTGLILMKEKS